ncbi:MAG TPA: hypothetical protein VJ717_12785 [Gemmatimonadaceae bacterium]|nr:hypothetical protein [Gemmatimonadaceae bacterium]
MRSLVFWSCTALLVFGELMIVRAWWLGRTPASRTTPNPRAREFLWIALPALVLALTLVVTWRAQSSVPNNAQADPHAGHAS